MRRLAIGLAWTAGLAVPASAQAFWPRPPADLALHRGWHARFVPRLG